MAEIGDTNLTLADHAARLDPSGGLAPVVEVLSQTNELLEDAVALRGNLTTGHKASVRAGLPTVYWRRLNKGVPDSKSIVVPVEEPCALMTAFSKPDREIVDLAEDKRRARFLEDRAFIEGMNQKAASTLIYGNKATEAEAFTGLAPRFGDLSAANGANILTGGGSGADNTSIWLVAWEDTKTALIFPKNTMAGLQTVDHGVQLVKDASNNDYPAYVTEFNWRLGMMVHDWRFVVRIANIDVSDLTKDASSGADIVDLMTQALEQIEALNMGRVRFYCNRTVRSFLRRQMRNSKNVNLTLDTVAGRRVLAFDEVPVRRVDAILNTEATVS